MTQDLAKCLVDLTNVTLATEGTSKFCLDHVEGGLDIGAEVVVLHEVPVQDKATLIRLLTIRSTNVGDWIPGAADIYLSCGYNLFWIIPRGHDCAFGDSQGQKAIARATNSDPLMKEVTIK